jgi:hypothetical protein
MKHIHTFESFIKEAKTYNYFPAPEMLAQLSPDAGELPNGEEAAGNADNALEDYLKKAKQKID